MKDHPILFSGPMVKAILAGSKTQTRRVIHGNPLIENVEWLDKAGVYPPYWKGKEGEPYTGWAAKMQGLSIHMPRDCPYGQKGDRLWVREKWTWCSSAESEKTRGVTFADGGQKFPSGHTYPGLGEGNYKPGAFDGIKWKPSIHMKRWMARIMLEVLEVRVQRLQEITEKDATAEGCDHEWYIDNPEPGAWPCPTCKGVGLYQAGSLEGTTEVDCEECNSAAKMFHQLWDSINSRRGYGWKMNPWVWVVEFKPLDVVYANK